MFRSRSRRARLDAAVDPHPAASNQLSRIRPRDAGGLTNKAIESHGLGQFGGLQKWLKTLPTADEQIAKCPPRAYFVHLWPRAAQGL